MASSGGTSSHTVEENMRIRFTQKLLALREDDGAMELEFPSTLGNIERKFLHQLARELGLVSKSSGKGDNRKITVSKHSGPAVPQVALERLMELPLPPAVASVLGTYFARFPVLPDEMEHLYQAAACKAARKALGPTMSAPLPQQSAHPLEPPPPSQTHRRRRRTRDARHPEVLEARRASYNMAQARRYGHAGYHKHLRARQALPAWSHQEAVCDLVVAHQCVMVSGGTGCGKSTQVPQFLLDDPRIGPSANMVVTQPRRISAIGVGERVAEERHETIGGTIGYAVRMEVSTSDATQVTFMTPGVLLRRLRSDPGLAAVTHVIIDEVHERDQNTEFLLIVLRDLLAARSDLRLILMSATLQTHKFSAYFDSIPIVTIGASTFPVEEFFLEDVLSQTSWLEHRKFRALERQAGGYNPSAARSAAEMIETLTFSKAKDASDLTCSLCGKQGFRSVLELGTHVGTCLGPEISGGGGWDVPAEVDGLEALEALLGDMPAAESFVAPSGKDARAPMKRGPSFAERLRGQTASVDGLAELENLLLAGGGRASAKAGDRDDDAGIGDDKDDDDDADYVGVDPEGGPRIGASGMGSEVAATAREADEVTVSRTGNAVDEESLQRYQYVHDDEEIDVDLIVALLEYAYASEYDKGATLVFMPGWQEISNLKDELEAHETFGNTALFKVLPLHSGVPTAKQKEIFKPTPPGCHKIIVSTNIAETSVTVPDVAFVVDAGRVKEKSYDPHLKTSTMDTNWVTQAASKQRRGRAGRVRAGVCWHLFSLRRYEAMRLHVESELLRTSLEELCLQAKALRLAPGRAQHATGLRAFLAKAVDAPHEKAVDHGIHVLEELGALAMDGTEELTALGTILSELVVHPRLGKMVLWATVLNCAGPALKLAAVCSYREPFVLPVSAGARRAANAAKKALATGYASDHLALLGAIDGFEQTGGRGRKKFCDDHFLSYSTMLMVQKIASQLGRDMTRFGFASPGNNGLPAEGGRGLMCSVLAAGLYPHVARRLQGESNFTCCPLTADGRKVRAHPGSLVSKKAGKDGKCGAAEEIVAFSELTRKTSKGQYGPSLLINQVTLAPPLALVLLCGTLEVEELPEGYEDEFLFDANEMGTGLGMGRGAGARSVILVLDGWLRYVIPRPLALQIEVLRLRLRRVFEEVVSNPRARPDGRSRTAVHFASQMLILEAKLQAQNELQNEPRNGSGQGGGASRSRTNHTPTRNQKSPARRAASHGQGHSPNRRKGNTSRSRMNGGGRR